MDGVPEYLKCQHVLMKMGRYHCYSSPVRTTEWEQHATLDIDLTVQSYYSERASTQEEAIRGLYWKVRESLWEICLAIEL